MAGETILIVEDRRENIVHLANNVLKPQGYKVLTAMDGQRGLGRILNEKPDLVIMDLNMPKMDGLEVLAALKEHQVTVPVILTTFYGSEQVASQALRLGAADYIVKPYNVVEMLKAIEKALVRRDPAPLVVEPQNIIDQAPTSVASQPHDTIEQAMPLTRQMERWMRDMNILTRVGKALLAQIDLERVYVRAVEAAIYVTLADYACLYLPGDASRLRLRAVRGPIDPRARLVDVPVDGGLAVEVARGGEAMVRGKGPGDPALFEVVGSALGPAVAAPMRWQRETMGVLLAARSPGEQGFGEGDAEWLSGLADYGAIAIRNATTCQSARTAQSAQNNEAVLSALEHEAQELARDLQAATERLNKLAAMLAEARKQS